jgi:hypothetical protein
MKSISDNDPNLLLSLQMESYFFNHDCTVRTPQIQVLTPGITEQQIGERWTLPLLTLIKAAQTLDSDIYVFLAKEPFDYQKGDYVSDVVLHHSPPSSARQHLFYPLVILATVCAVSSPLLCGLLP